MQNGRVKILIAAGGTGGHVFPAIAIADEIKKLQPQTALWFVGTKGKIESRVVPERGYPLTFIWISGFHRQLRIENLMFPAKVFVSLVQSFFLMKRVHPDIVIGTGGYVCGPVLFAASLLGIPTVVHESNSFPGITTRMLSTRTTKIFTAFEATARWLKRKDNIELAGTPTRDVLGSVTREEGIRFFHLDPSKKTVLVFGGSLGAASINRAVKKEVNENMDSTLQWIWQTGRTEAAVAKEMSGLKNCWVGPFIDKMEYAYAAADVVVCRAGATTLAELTRLGKASVLVPYPFAAADHQTFNARTMVEAGAAVLIADRDVNAKLKTEVHALLIDDMKRQQMCAASRALGKPNAGREIAQRILEMAAS
ncbi:MAG: undecaprenyldiphospho-muramoylpentapeptide beta-N-acetylglucosaminyltransferase [Ignavibacteriae bacterium]|nr:MAG: undecaprenyldiphospho-muramoylpentapeptide beta-N-acetylglucosaminyltransferase [Ignavibacteriota bacterium]